MILILDDKSQKETGLMLVVSRVFQNQSECENSPASQKPDLDGRRDDSILTL